MKTRKACWIMSLVVLTFRLEGELAAQDQIIYKTLYAVPEFTDARQLLAQWPKTSEKTRLYLCNGDVAGFAGMKTELTSERQTKSSGHGVMAVIVQKDFDSFSTWKGSLPFSCEPKQIEMWLTFGVPEAPTEQTLTLKVGIKINQASPHEHEIVLKHKWGVENRAEQAKAKRDPPVIQVLERWNVSGISLSAGQEIAIGFSSPCAGLDVIGYGLSHIDFCGEPKTPAPLTAVWLRTERRQNAAAARPSPGVEDTVGIPPREGIGEKPTETRTWRDASGKYSVEAAFQRVAAGKVRLLKPEGVILEVPLERLSEHDRDWIRRRSQDADRKE